jgi:hypothetical protein
MLSSIRSSSSHQSMVERRFGTPPPDLAGRIEWLERKCRAMRAQGLAGHWAYDLALHRNLLTVLEAERAALAATESLPVSPDGRRLRAA